MGRMADPPQARPRGLHPILLLALYVALALLPLLLAALHDAPSRRLLHEASSGAAMVGFAMLLVQFVLSGRYEALSGRFGIDLTMRFHQLAARTLLVLLVLHPLLIALAAQGPDPARVLGMLQRLFQAPPMRSGVIAWWLLILLVASGIWRDRLPVPYEIWRLSHGLGAAAIAALSLHHTLAVGRHAGSVPLAVLWGLLTLLALLTLVQVYLLRPLVLRRRPYRLIANRKVAERQWELVIEPRGEGALSSFMPGQFVWLTLGRSPFLLCEHPFSLGSAPAELPRMRFLIKEAGDFTRTIGGIREGAPAFVDGPYGNFTPVAREAEGLVLIAGGVGIAPMLSILRDMRARADRRPVVLIYGNRIAGQICHREELEALGAKLDFRLELVLSEPPEGWAGRVGMLDAAMLEACLGRGARGLHLVCGPGPMMTAVERGLLGLGVPAELIVLERFQYD
jgi:predicted ferric reductase